MSIKLMDKVWELQSLSQPRKMLLLSISDYASDEGVAWPAVKTLMRKCSLRSESGTRRAINELVEMGWLSKKERPRKERQGKHQQDTNLYQINLVKLYKEAAIHEPVPRNLSKNRNCEPVHDEASPSDGSRHDGLQGGKNARYEPVPRTPDPSVRSKTDPSVKTSCQLPAETDQEITITDQAKQVLKHLNLVTGSKYQAGKTSLDNIRARLKDGFTPEELVLVVDYTNAKWGNDLAMTEYLRPITLFGPSKFPGYLKAGGAWNKNGRPACINGKWQTAATNSHRVTPATGVIPHGFTNGLPPQGVDNSGGAHDEFI